MIKKILFSVATILLFTNVILAQQSNLRFANNSNFIGKINESNLPATINFIYTNKGTEEIKIIAIKMNSGCTVTNWNKNKGILPGKGGALIFNFTTTTIGSFKDKIIITTNEKVNNEIVLTFGGEVTPRKKTRADMFTYTDGKLRFSTQILKMGQILNTKKKMDTIFVVNNSKKAITMEPSYLNTEYLKVECFPAEMEPGAEGFIVAKYDASIRYDYGNIIDTIYVQTNDGNDSLKKLFVKVEILEDFSKIKPEKRKLAPKAYMDNTNYNFQYVKVGAVVKQSFNISNRGKTELVIRKVESSCDCLDITYPQKVRFSKEGVFTVVMNTSKKKGSVSETITIITNDPDNPKIVMHITGLVD